MTKSPLLSDFCTQGQGRDWDSYLEYVVLVFENILINTPIQKRTEVPLGGTLAGEGALEKILELVRTQLLWVSEAGDRDGVLPQMRFPHR